MDIYLPALLLGFLLSSLYGAIFHLWRGGNFGRLLFYLVISWAGFLMGQLLASYLNFKFDSLVQLHLATASLGSFLFLGLGYWLTLPDEGKVKE